MAYLGQRQPLTSTDNGFTTEQLLQIAKLEGGSVGEVAEELTNPQRSMSATVSDRIKRSFSGLVEILTAPNQAVAGILSKDLTIGEAVKENINVSDVLLGDKPKDLSLPGKIGSFVGRTAIDVLFDPLTYITFGTGRGIIGLTKGMEIYAGEKLAAQRGIKAGDTAVLNQAGENLADKFVEAKRNGLRATFMKNKEVELINSGKSIDEAKKILDELEDSVTDSEVAETFGKRFSRSDAGQAIGKMLENNPALAETYLDKGGVKIFGQSILEGQRIARTIKAIPYFTELDRATAPVRNMMGSLFSRKYTLNGRVPQLFDDIVQKSKDLAESQKNAALTLLPKVYEKLNISENEARFINAAIEHNVLPRDKKAAEIWKMVNGFEPEDKMLREEVWEALQFEKMIDKKNLKTYRAAGIPLAALPGYRRHMLSKENMPKQVFRTGSSQETKAQLFAKYSTLIDDAGRRIPVEFDKKPGRDGLVKGRVLLPDGTFAEKKFEATEGDKFIEKGKGSTAGSEYTRVRIYVEEAKEFGVDFEDNSLLVSLASSYEAIKVSTARYFSQDIAKSFGVPASQASGGMRAISSSGLKTEGTDISNFFMNKKGEELYFDPVIADAVEGFTKSLNEDAASEAVKYYDKIQNYFKASVTSIWPAFHGRNAISNVFQMFSMLGSQVFNPAMHVKVASVMKGEMDFKKMQLALDKGEITGKEFSDYMGQAAFVDGTGYKWSRAELRSAIMDNMVAFHPRNLGQVDQYAVSGQEFTTLHKRLFPESKFDKMYQGKLKYVNPLSTDNAAFKAGFAVGQTVEDYSRLMMFMGYLKETGDVQQAAKMTKQVLFDYSNLSEFERRFMRRIFPFYTYSRKNIELQVKTLFKNPARVAGTIRSVYTLGDVMGNDRLTDEEKKLLPDWMKDGHNAVLSRENNHITVLSSLGIPIDQALGHLDPHTILGMTTPLIKFPIEKMSGYSFFHGKPISEVNNAAAFSSPAVPEYIRDYIGFTEVEGVNKNTGEKFKYYTSLRPDRMHTILNLPPTSRTWSYLRSMQDADLTTQAKVMGFLIGVKPESFDMTVEAARREKENKAELEKVLKQAGVGYTFTRYVLPEEQREELGFTE